MSTLALQSYIGQTALLQSDKLRFAVRIVDAKMAYGSIRLLVTPEVGEGTVWVDSSRIQIESISPIEKHYRKMNWEEVQS